MSLWLPIAVALVYWCEKVDSLSRQPLGLPQELLSQQFETNGAALLDTFAYDTLESSLQGAPPMSANVAADILANMRSFVESSVLKRTVLVTLGDSTMGGVASRMFEALHTTESIGLWGFNQCSVWGGSCKSFKDAPNLSLSHAAGDDFSDVFENLRVAISVLDESDCTFGGRNFFVHSYFSGRLIHYSWGFGAECFGACWKPCLTNSIRALQPTAVVMNQGLHLLHAYPFRSCHNTGEDVSYFDCGKHEHLVADILGQMQSAAPIFIWKTSNSVCDTKFYGGYRAAIDDWHDALKADTLEQACQHECSTFSGDRPCRDEVIDARSVKIQRDASLRAVANVQAESAVFKRPHKIGVVDAFAVTEGMCNATTDGRHYLPLDPEIVKLLAAELASLAK